MHMTVHMQSELIWPASMHDLEVRAWISRMQRLSARAQGSKGSDSKPSMSAIRLLQQQGGAWQCGAVRAGAPCGKHVQGRSASESGHAESTLDRRARVEHHSASRGGIACQQCEARAARAGEAFRVRVLCCCANARARARLGTSSVSRLFTPPIHGASFPEV